MTRLSYPVPLLLVLSVVFVSPSVFGQHHSNTSATDAQFGPVMRAYLGYLRNEQEVVDDRISRREISPAYYRRNSERIRALRQTAIRLVSQSGNDYVPELEAVTVDEFGTLFEDPPKPVALRVNSVLTSKFRYLGAVHTGETFYLFARLDPYEQAALMEQQPKTSSKTGPASPAGQPVGQVSGRPRRSAP
jgi:hypothetical protein